MALSRRTEFLLLAMILAVAVGLRLSNLSRAPNGLMPDEGSNAYDAWSILETGADRWGEEHPFFLRAFGRGDYRPALYVYTIVPFVALFGPERLDLAVRMPAALMGVMTVFGAYLIVRRANGAFAALMAAAILTVCPWDLIMSRFGHEACLTPLFGVFLVLAMQQCAAWLESVEPRGSGVADWCVLGLVVGISPYTYASMKLFVPVMLLAFAIVYRRRLIDALGDNQGRRAILSGAVCCVVVAGPMIWATITRWEEINARAEEMSLFHQGQPIAYVLADCFTNWLYHYGLQWLFIRGADHVFLNIHGVGQINWITGPLVLAGLWCVLRTPSQSSFRWILIAWFVLHPIASALTIGSPHVLRAACGVGAFSCLAGIGAAAIVGWFGRSVTAARLIGLAIAAGVVVNGAWTVHVYFRLFARNSQMAALCQADWREALFAVGDQWRDFEKVFVSDHASVERRWVKDQIYIHVLNYLRIPPAEFQQWDKDIAYIPQDAAFHTIKSMGPFVMSTKPDVLADFFATWDGKPVLFIARPGDVSGGTVVAEVIWPNDELRFEIIVVEPRDQD